MDGNTARSKLGLYTVTRHFLAVLTSCDDELGTREGINIGGTNINNIKYVVDAVLLVDTEENLQNMMDELNGACGRY